MKKDTTNLEVMTVNSHRTKFFLYSLVVIMCCSCMNHQVTGAPQPFPPGMMYREDYGLEVPSQALVNRLKQIVAKKEEKIEREIDELAEEQMEIQALMDTKVKNEQQASQDFSNEEGEALPVPAAVYQNINSGKRTSFMALCHFKICNMGRKRQM